MMPDIDAGMISFIVPAYNEERLLGHTLASIHAAAHVLSRPYEIVVVDDASTDSTVAIARQGGARVVSVRLRQIAGTRNAGARAARGSILIFVDADTLVPGRTLAAAPLRIEVVRVQDLNALLVPEQEVLLGISGDDAGNLNRIDDDRSLLLEDCNGLLHDPGLRRVEPAARLLFAGWCEPLVKKSARNADTRALQSRGIEKSGIVAVRNPRTL